MKKKIIIGICLAIIIILAIVGISTIYFFPNKEKTANLNENVIKEAEEQTNQIENSMNEENVIDNTINNDQNTNTANENENKQDNTSTTQKNDNKTSNSTQKTDKNTTTTPKKDTTTNQKNDNTNTTTKTQSTVKVSGIFNKYESKANQKLQTMTLDEKIGQLFLVRFPTNNAKETLKQYQFGGYIFFGKDFQGTTKSQVTTRMNELQKVAKVPILTAVDEEGGTVVRVSSNTNLAKARFQSPSALYALGGFEQIKKDTIEKSKLLGSLGINLNLAPVVDVSTNSNDFMYKRALGQNTELTSTYAKTVISSSKGYKVSYTLKHFPGYGNNVDTHTGKAIDNRSYSDIVKNDLPPFSEGIKAGAEAVLVSHNIVTSIDKDNAASLSKKVHNILRNDLGFTGIIITDDLDMGAVSGDSNAAVKAVQAGNDLIITTDYKASISSVKQAVKNGNISEDTINKAVARILAWKYYKGMM